MHMRWMLRLFRSLLLVSLLAGVGLALTQPAQAEDASDVTDTTETVVIRDNRFVAVRLTVAVGATVTWEHTGSNLHTVSPLDGNWESGVIARDERFSYTFTEPGTFLYLCRLHEREGMRGVISVEVEEADGGA